MVAVTLWLCFVAWAVASPPGSAPDENAHLGAAWAVSHGQSPSARVFIVPAKVAAQSCFSRTHVASPCAPPTGEIGAATVVLPNTTNSYPPVFHRFLGLFFTSDIVSSVLAMRIAVASVSALLIMIPLVLISRISGFTAVRGVGLALLVALTPLVFFLCASVNPSAWELAGAVCAWGSFVALALARSRRDVVWSSLGMATGVMVGALVRPHGGETLVVGLLLGAPVLLARLAPTAPASARRFWSVVIAIYGVVGAVGAVVIARGALAVTWIANPPVDDRSPAYQWAHAALISVRYWVNSIGRLGWNDTEVPLAVVAAFFAVGGFLVLAALSRRRSSIAFSIGMVSLGSLFLTTAVLATSRPPGGYLQSRYLWPVYAGVLFVAVAGLASTHEDWVDRLYARHVRIFAGVALTLASGLGYSTNIRRYVTGGAGSQAGATDVWHPVLLGATTLTALFCVVYALFVCSLLVDRVAWQGSRQRQSTHVE